MHAICITSINLLSLWKFQQIQDAPNNVTGYNDNIMFQKALSPNLPEDLAISFYIQSHKLIFVAYQLSSVHGMMRIDSCQADCAVPWLSDVLFMLTAALHMCQQLKDKVTCYIVYVICLFQAVLHELYYEENS